MSTAHEAQIEFDNKYVTSSEICNYLNISRPALLQGRRRERLPVPISVKGTNLCLWIRDTVWPTIEQWRQEIDGRRQTSVRGSNA